MPWMLVSIVISVASFAARAPQPTSSVRVRSCARHLVSRVEVLDSRLPGMPEHAALVVLKNSFRDGMHQLVYGSVDYGTLFFWDDYAINDQNRFSDARGLRTAELTRAEYLQSKAAPSLGTVRARINKVTNQIAGFYGDNHLLPGDVLRRGSQYFVIIEGRAGRESEVTRNPNEVSTYTALEFSARPRLGDRSSRICKLIVEREFTYGAGPRYQFVGMAGLAGAIHIRPGRTPDYTGEITEYTRRAREPKTVAQIELVEFQPNPSALEGARRRQLSDKPKH